MIDAFFFGSAVLLILAPIGCAAWLAMLWLALKLLGVKPRYVLDEINLPESVFFAGYGVASAYLVASLFGRFI